MQHMIWRDKFDHNIFHVGYRWPKSDRAEYSQRLAFSIHADDLEGMFGEPFYHLAAAMDDMMFIEITGEFHDDT